MNEVEQYISQFEPEIILNHKTKIVPITIGINVPEASQSTPNVLEKLSKSKLHFKNTT